MYSRYVPIGLIHMMYHWKPVLLILVRRVEEAGIASPARMNVSRPRRPYLPPFTSGQRFTGHNVTTRVVYWSYPRDSTSCCKLVYQTNSACNPQCLHTLSPSNICPTISVLTTNFGWDLTWPELYCIDTPLFPMLLPRTWNPPRYSQFWWPVYLGTVKDVSLDKLHNIFASWKLDFTMNNLWIKQSSS